MNRWEEFGLPNNMLGKSFLDVGCWGGELCTLAKEKIACSVIGIDLVRSPKIKEQGWHFYQMDVFSSQFLMLPQADWVLCAGVFYHVPNPVELLLRLKALMHKESVLVLETAYLDDKSFLPVMRFCKGKSNDDNYSNWWLPNLACLGTLFEECGFLVKQALIKEGSGRIVYHLKLHRGKSKKMLPRKEKYMKT